LQNKEKEILNKIVKEYGDLSLQTLLQHIYDMEDVKQAEFAKVIL
jgi:hypothetical protein